MTDKGMKESEVLSWTLEILRSHNIFCWRQNTGAFKTQNGGFFRSSRAGVADIIGCLPDGRFLAIECKRQKGGKVSKAQNDFLLEVADNNGVALVVSDPAKFILEIERLIGEEN